MMIIDKNFAELVRYIEPTKEYGIPGLSVFKCKNAIKSIFFQSVWGKAVEELCKKIVNCTFISAESKEQLHLTCKEAAKLAEKILKDYTQRTNLRSSSEITKYLKDQLDQQRLLQFHLDYMDQIETQKALEIAYAVTPFTE